MFERTMKSIIAVAVTMTFVTGSLLSGHADAVVCKRAGVPKGCTAAAKPVAGPAGVGTGGPAGVGGGTVGGAGAGGGRAGGAGGGAVGAGSRGTPIGR